MSTRPTKKYLPDEITVQVGGDLIHGWAPGEFVVIEENAPRMEQVVGTDGEVAVSRILDRTATITIKLLQTSDSNDIFEDMMAKNQNGPGLPGVKNIMIRDRQGRSLHEAPQCFVLEAPSATYDKSATPREWKLGVPQLSNQIKGASVL
jgi:hypothetical protein